MLQMTMELVEDVTLNWRPGDTLITQYGKGKLLEKTVTQPDALTSITSVKIQLEWGGAILSCPMASDVIHKLLSPKEYEKAMEHLEQVRRLSVAIQCHDWGIDTHEPEACVACLFQKPEIKSANSNRRRKRYFRTSSSATNNTKAATRKTKRCDVCANPVCSHHQHSMGNTTEGVEFFIICVDCSHDLNQAQEHLYAHHPQLLQNLQRLVQYYTRMVLQLSFSVSNLPQVAYTLTHEQQRDGAISLGNSALGFAGAALGVAGAAAMLTPAGPAILLAAVATSATSGTFQGMHASYQKFWSSKTARQMADRCLGWHGLCLGILNALEQLRRDLIEQEHDFDGKTKSSKKAQQSRQNSMDIWNALAVGSFATTRQAMTGIGVTSSLGASYSQAINTSLQGIPVVGAAFAIGCMAMDGKSWCCLVICVCFVLGATNPLTMRPPIANNMASSFKQLNTPAKKAIALQGVEQSFSKHVVNTIRPTADMIIQGVDDLQERMNERRRMEEAALIEEELQGLGGEADLNSDEELERELANL